MASATSIDFRLACVVLGALVLSGCTSAEPEKQTPPTATTDGSASAAPLSPFSYRLTHDFVMGEGNYSFEVPAGSAPADITVWFGGAGSAVGDGGQGTIEVRRPDGTVVAATSNPPGSTAILGRNQPVTEENVKLDAGTWTVLFTGSGAYKGELEIVPYGTA